MKQAVLFVGAKARAALAAILPFFVPGTVAVRPIQQQQPRPVRAPLINANQLPQLMRMHSQLHRRIEQAALRHGPGSWPVRQHQLTLAVVETMLLEHVPENLLQNLPR